MEQPIENLSNTLSEKLETMNPGDDGFKEGYDALVKMQEAKAKADQVELDKKWRWKEFTLKLVLGIAAAVTPFIIRRQNHNDYDQDLEKVMYFETTGGVRSESGKSVLKDLRNKNNH